MSVLIRLQNLLLWVRADTFEEAGRATLAFAFGMTGFVVGAGSTALLSVSASITVAMAEAELQRRRKIALDLDNSLQNIEVSLDLFKDEKAGLV